MMNCWKIPLNPPFPKGEDIFIDVGEILISFTVTKPSTIRIRPIDLTAFATYSLYISKSAYIEKKGLFAMGMLDWMRFG